MTDARTAAAICPAESFCSRAVHPLALLLMPSAPSRKAKPTRGGGGVSAEKVRKERLLVSLNREGAVLQDLILNVGGDG